MFERFVHICRKEGRKEGKDKGVQSWLSPSPRPIARQSLLFDFRMSELERKDVQGVLLMNVILNFSLALSKNTHEAISG